MSKINETCYAVCVNYGASLEEMIMLGEYDACDGSIRNGIFRIKKPSSRADVEITLLHFGFEISCGKEAVNRICLEGYRPATLHELLALGAEYQDLQCEFSIAALGSISEDAFDNCCNVVAYLAGENSRRRVSLARFDFPFSEETRFAVVRNGDSVTSE
ncbi:MAG: hypothetical protein HGB08_03670 [Candidatus Moranbacteria bacterium]|nr:hypothetical protein [Candidatus Moranbacteria bacterium]